MNQWLQIGRVRDAHGIKGEIFVALKAGAADWLEDLSEFKIQDHIYAVESAKPHKNGLIVRLKGFVDRNQAEAIRGQFVSIPESYVQSQDDETPFLGEILGYQVNDEKLGPLGDVIGFGSNGVQDLLEIKGPKYQFEMPFVDAFVLSMDRDARVLFVSLPDGLASGEFA